MRRLITFGAGVLALAGAAAWLALGASAATRSIVVQDDVFSDAMSLTSTTTITVGDTVLWTWSGSNPHTVSSTAAEPFDSGAPQTSGTFSHTFNALGTFTYVCVVHAGMSGSVVVQAAAATATATNSPQPSSTTAPQATNTPVPQATNADAATSTPASATSSPIPGGSATPAPAGATVAAPTQAPAGAPASVVQIPRTGTGTGAGGSVSAGGGLLWLAAAAMGGIGGMVLVLGRRRRDL